MLSSDGEVQLTVILVWLLSTRSIGPGYWNITVVTVLLALYPVMSLLYARTWNKGRG